MTTTTHDTTLAGVRKRRSTTPVTPPPTNPKKDGDFYDTCPKDACIEVEPHFKIGGKSSRGEYYLDHSQYNAHVEKGGCGANWERSTKQGMAQDAKKGIRSKWPTRAALVGKFTDVPSQTYRSRYDCAFQKCACVSCSPLWEAGLVARCSLEHHDA